MDEYVIIAPTQREAIQCFRLAREVLAPWVRKWYSKTRRELVFDDFRLIFMTEEQSWAGGLQGRRGVQVSSSRHLEHKLDELKERAGNAIV